jgi:hypothetical protein
MTRTTLHIRNQNKFAYSLQTEVDEQVFKQYMDTTVKLGQVY